MKTYEEKIEHLQRQGLTRKEAIAAVDQATATAKAIEDASTSDLTDWQKKKLEMLRKGYGISAARRGWKAEEWRQMQDLVKRGLVRKTSGAKWNPAGAFVLSA